MSLIRDIPVALRIEGYASFNNCHSKSLDFSSPFLVKLLSGGAIARNISYYLYFFFSERGKVAGLEDAFMMFNDSGATWMLSSASSRSRIRCSKGNCG